METFDNKKNKILRGCINYFIWIIAWIYSNWLIMEL